MRNSSTRKIRAIGQQLDEHQPHGAAFAGLDDVGGAVGLVRGLEVLADALVDHAERVELAANLVGARELGALGGLLDLDLLHLALLHGGEQLGELRLIVLLGRATEDGPDAHDDEDEDEPDEEGLMVLLHVLRS